MTDTMMKDSRTPKTRHKPDARTAGAGTNDRPRKAHYVHHPSFTLPGAGKRLWGPKRQRIDVAPYQLLPEIEEDSAPTRAENTVLSPDQERTLFLRYNYAKYRMNKLAEKRATARRTEQFRCWRERARNVREKIIHANLPLVPAMAKRKRVGGVELADKISEGYMALLRSVEHFDVSRGFKFSTYACRAILAALYRLGTRTRSYRKHVTAQLEPTFQRDDYSERRHRKQRADAIESVRLVLMHDDARLNDVERRVIEKRFPLQAEQAPRPRWKIGRELGVTTDRVRKIEKKSLGKLATALDHMLTA